MNMKKVSFVAVLAASTLALVACGEKKDPTPAVKTGSVAEVSTGSTAVVKTGSVKTGAVATGTTAVVKTGSAMTGSKR